MPSTANVLDAIAGDGSLAGAPPIDLAHLRRYTLGDAALEKEVLQLFLDQLPRTIAALAEAQRDRDWKLATHALKGSGRCVGAWRIAALAETAERLAFDSPADLRSEAVARLSEAAIEAGDFIRAR